MDINRKKKIVILVIVISLIVAFKVFNLGQYLTLSYLKESLDKFNDLYEKHQALVIAGYFIIYVLTTSLSLPGASPLGIVGGALFGFWVATLVVSFASTIGATLACFVSRFYWVSQIGMLPGTMVYVNAGKELAKIESIKGIFSPRLIISFALLGIFPIAVKKLVAFYRKRKEKTTVGY